MQYDQAASEQIAFLKDAYRYFHRFPEPSKMEFETHKKIREYLTADGIDFDAPAPNITIAKIGHGKPVVGYRADTDALQQNEETGLPYSSERPSLMHACGHDAHIACGLAIARILKQEEETLGGMAKIIFQPAEEGEFGAKAVLATGLVNDVQGFFGIHVWSPFESGSLHVSQGGVASSVDMFTINIHGRGGHGALPHECIDSVVCASALVMNLQTIASRFISPINPVVCTIGSLQAGTRCNIIAADAKLEGTLRAFDIDTYNAVHEHFDRIVRSTCETYSCTYDVDMRHAGDVTWNDLKMTEIAVKAGAGEALPDEPCMLSDDMGEYSSVAPVCYARVGVRNEAIGACYPHHSKYFRIDENALPKAVAWGCGMLKEFIDSHR